MGSYEGLQGRDCLWAYSHGTASMARRPGEGRGGLVVSCCARESLVVWNGLWGCEACGAFIEGLGGWPHITTRPPSHQSLLAPCPLAR